MTSLEDISFNGKYSNGQKCNYSNSTMNRCGPFQGGGVNSVIRRCGLLSDVPPINEVLCLEPITIEDHKCNHLNKAKKALGSAVDGFCGQVPSKIEGLKASVQDCSIHARRRVKKFDATLCEMSKYMNQLKASRLQKNRESNNVKMSVHYPLTPDIESQKTNERMKNTNLNKRACSSMTDTLISAPNNKGKDVIREDDKTDDVMKGECGEKKVKRKRSFGASFNSLSPDAHKLGSSIDEQSLPKAKASRISRAASVKANATTISPEAHEKSSQINRKRSAPLDSSQGIVKWGDHRANKISRTRRTNVVSPLAVESADVASSGVEHLLKRISSISSPLTSVAEYEESIDFMEQKKSKPVGLRRHGRNTRSAASPKAGLSPETKPKKAVSKPTKGSRFSEVKSTSGRPPKKIMDKKNAASPGQSLMSPMKSPIDSEDDWEELVAATTKATGHLNSVSTGTIWKQCNDALRPVSSEDIFFLKQSLNQTEEQVDVRCTSKTSSDLDPLKNETEAHPCKRNGQINPLYQRVLSALIIEDDYKEVENSQSFTVHSPVNIGGAYLFNDSTVDNTALMKELQILGLTPERLPDLDDNDSDSLSGEIAELTHNLNQLIEKKKTRVHALNEAAEEDFKQETRRVETKAMDNLVEIAFKKHLAPKSTKSLKNAAQSFTIRTNLWCRRFEESGDCSFLKSAFLHAQNKNQDHALAAKTAAEEEKMAEVCGRFVTAKRSRKAQAQEGEMKTDLAAEEKDKPESPWAQRSKDVANMSDLQALDMELGAANQDLGNWLDIEGLPDNDVDVDFSLDGLDIPMDNLSDLGFLS